MIVVLKFINIYSFVFYLYHTLNLLEGRDHIWFLYVSPHKMLNAQQHQANIYWINEEMNSIFFYIL